MEEVEILIPRDHHSGDSFREIIDEWAKLGLVEKRKTNKVKYLTLTYRKKKVILYDWPVINSKVFFEPHDIILFGNEIPKHSKGWIFWGRHPKKLEKLTFSGIKLKKIHGSVFLGNYHNPTQGDSRIKVDWSAGVDHFNLIHSTQPRFTQSEYLKQISKYSFGLTLPGRGPKCNRELELLACGTIPIITPGVSIKYHAKWIEREHYITAKNPQELKQKIADIPQDVAVQMSQNCIELYQREYSIRSSFFSTIRLIDSLINDNNKNYKNSDTAYYVLRDFKAHAINYFLHTLKMYGLFRRIRDVTIK